MLSIRKIGVIGRTYRNLNRYRRILAILFKYGFGDLVDRLRIDQYIEVGLQMISRNRRETVEKLTRAERVRLIFEELGPTFIKLGQVLSLRPDLIPVEFTAELSKLQDEVPPFAFSDFMRVIDFELGPVAETFFTEIEPVPIASASIGQVHRARLAGGGDAAVKVQRPGIREIIEVDLEIMLHLATLMERNIEEISFHRPVRVVEEFARTLEREIDYTVEAASMERVARQFLGDPNVYIPKVYHGATTPHILTMEFISGIKISETDTLVAAGMDLARINERGADFILRQVFDFGFFHADMHPGNILVLPGNVICLLDFGMVGSVDLETRERFIDLIDSVVHQDASKATEALLAITEYGAIPDKRRLRGAVAEFMGRHLYKPLREIHVGRLLQDLIEMTTRHRLIIPPDIFLMLKAFATVEGVGLLLDPGFDMVSYARPFIVRVKLARYTPARIADDILKISTDSLHFFRRFPQELLEISRLLTEEKLTVRFELKGFDRMMATQDQASNRIAFSIVIAALIVGSALITMAGIPPFLFGISLIGFVGFVGAAVMGIWLMIAILGRGRL